MAAPMPKLDHGKFNLTSCFSYPSSSDIGCAPLLAPQPRVAYWAYLEGDSMVRGTTDLVLFELIIWSKLSNVMFDRHFLGLQATPTSLLFRGDPTQNVDGLLSSK
jgi:hypothetical protein